MNERIKELAKEAGLVQGGWANADRVKIWKEDPDNPGSLEKFAQLLVAECLDIVEDEDDGSADTKAIRWAMIRIKKHFGVEESKGWICPKCGTDRTKQECPKGHTAALTGECPMIGEAQ